MIIHHTTAIIILFWYLYLALETVPYYCTGHYIVWSNNLAISAVSDVNEKKGIRKYKIDTE